MHLLAIALAAVTGAAGSGPSIWLNGVRIDGVTDQRFENVTVVIDEKGDVHIEARGYEVRLEPAPSADAVPAGAATPSAAAPAAPFGGPSAPRSVATLAKRYFVATESSHPDGAGVDVAVFVNATWVREIRAGEPPAVFEVTKYLIPGPNKVVLSAKRRAGGDRGSAPRDATLRIFVGEGIVTGDEVAMGVPLVEMTCTAGETGDRTEEFVLVAH